MKERFYYGYTAKTKDGRVHYKFLELIDNTIKSWIVYDENTEEGVVVFSTNLEDAIKNGSSELNTNEESIKAVRSKNYDKYYKQGSVPKDVLLSDGWRL